MGPKPRSIEERFLAKVDKTEGCWLWTARIQKHRNGIGMFGIFNLTPTKTTVAHKMSLILTGHIVPDNVNILHRCKNYLCVNPSHLYLGRAKRIKTIDHPGLFWAKVRKTIGCWEWCGSRKGRYGNLTVKRKNVLAHRFAWEITFGPIPRGLFVCHHCDNKKCVRPDHLFLGTHNDNMHDMVIKGRHNPPRGNKHGTHTRPDRIARGDRHGAKKHPEKICRGEKHGRSKLSLLEVHKIRDLYTHENKKINHLASQFNISRAQIERIVRNRLWKNM